MHKIIINKKEIEEFGKKGLPKRYYEEFIFNEFQLIRPDFKSTIFIRDNRWDTLWIYYEAVVPITIIPSENEIKVKFYEDLMNMCNLKSEIINYFKDKTITRVIIKDKSDKTLNGKKVKIDLMGEENYKEFISQTAMYAMNVYDTIQNIMNESYKRKSIEKAKKEILTIQEFDKSRKHRKMVKEDKYLLSTIINYASYKISRKHYISCLAWDVRGHYRHYKSGKVVFVKSYEKGKERNKGFIKESNNYGLNRPIVSQEA